MMGIAAGIATTGKVPFASTFAMFAAGRAFEQVRNSVGYPKLNVKIGATHGGISVGEDGATQDVYKRQAYDRVLSTRIGAGAAEAILDGEYGIMIGIVNGKIKRVPLEAVSYTHLDVYKRQYFHPANKSLFL